MNNVSDSNRIYGIDILRIVSMLFIITLHILGQGGILSSLQINTPKFEVCKILEATAYCSVDCYALISGFVGINAKYKPSKIIKLWIIVVFYCITITICFNIAVPNTITIGSYIKAIMPIMTRQYWYFTSYFCLFLFIPFINGAINSLSKKQNKICLIFAFVIFSILQIFFGEQFFTNYGYCPFWLIILYIFGAVIKKFNLFDNIESYKKILVFIACSLFIWAWGFFIRNTTLFDNLNGHFISLVFKRPEMFCSYVAAPVLIEAICLLSIFKSIKTKPKYNNIISILSKTTFQVYIIHNHPLFYDFLSNKFNFVSEWNTISILFFIIFTSMFIFIICSLIELIRTFIFKKLQIDFFVNKILSKIDEIYIKYIIN